VLVLVDSSGSGGCIGRRSALDATFKDAFYVSTVRRTFASNRESALTRSVHRGGAVLLGDANQAEHRPEAHFGLRVASHRAARDFCDVWAKLARPVSHPLRRPFAVVGVLAWAVLRVGYSSAGARVAAPVGCDADAAVSTLDDAWCRAHLDGLLAQLERNAVVATIKLDVVVDIGARLLALRQLEAEPRERLHARAIE